MKYLSFLLLVLISLPVLAQEQTLISGDVEHGGFGGPSVKITSINGENAVLVGGRGGWIINHKFVLGAAGYGLASNVYPKGSDSSRHMEMGYGGLNFEYITYSDHLVHLSLELLIGGGAMRYKEDDDFDFGRPSDGFFILEPGINANLNVTHFFRISCGASYRHISGLRSNLSTNSDLSGVSAMFTLKFGNF